MLTSSPASWSVRGTTLAVWLLAAGSAAYWALQLGTSPQRGAPLAASARLAVNADPGAIARLLGSVPSAPGAAPAGPTLASRFTLVGLAAERAGGGVALIAVDGKPARPYRVGSSLDEGLVLQSLRGRTAAIGPRGGLPALTLELPAAAPLLGVGPAPGMAAQPAAGVQRPATLPAPR